MLPPLAVKDLMAGSRLMSRADDFDCHGELDLRVEPCRHLMGTETLNGLI